MQHRPFLPMFPIRSLVYVPTRPWTAYGLVMMNCWIFLRQFGMSVADERGFIMRWGVVPSELLGSTTAEVWFTPITSMFIHGSLAHLAGNMWFLIIFARTVEHRLGHARFFLFYILCGCAAVVAQVFIDPTSHTPMVGASGAIAGVLAAFVALNPRARILTLIPIFIFLHFAEIPAFFFIFIWFGYQLLMGLSTLGLQMEGGVAFFAHIGGFIAGLLIVATVAGRSHSRRSSFSRT